MSSTDVGEPASQLLPKTEQLLNFDILVNKYPLMPELCTGLFFDSGWLSGVEKLP
jgi:hypothetical protein